LPTTASSDETKDYIKKFGEKFKQFREIRKIEICPITDEMTKKMIENMKGKLTSLQNTIIELAVHNIEVKEYFKGKEKTSALDFYIKNTKLPYSTNEIQALQEYQQVNTEHKENSSIFKTLLLENEVFVTCSNDTTIQIYSHTKSRPPKWQFRKLEGHVGSVLNIIRLQSGELCSASADKTIRIWNIAQGSCRRVLSGSSLNSVYSTYLGEVEGLLELPNNILIGGGYDDIRFWNLKEIDNDKACTRILPNKGYCKAIILINDEEMACGSDHNINIFKIIGSDVPLKTFAGHKKTVGALLLHSDKQRMLSSSVDNSIKIWDVRTGSCIKTISENEYVCSQSLPMVLYKEAVVAVGFCPSIKFWNIENGTFISTLQCRTHVYGLTMNSKGILISCGAGNIVSYWSQ